MEDGGRAQTCWMSYTVPYQYLDFYHGLEPWLGLEVGPRQVLGWQERKQLHQALKPNFNRCARHTTHGKMSRILPFQFPVPISARVVACIQAWKMLQSICQGFRSENPQAEIWICPQLSCSADQKKNDLHIWIQTLILRHTGQTTLDVLSRAPNDCMCKCTSITNAWHGKLASFGPQAEHLGQGYGKRLNTPLFSSVSYTGASQVGWQ